MHVGDWAILSGYTLVHQYCHIGAHAFSGMGTAIGKDVPAFVTVFGSPAEARSMNFEGMRRRGFSDEVIHVLRRCYKIVYRQGLTSKTRSRSWPKWPRNTLRSNCSVSRS